jgi:hypothetical protein
MNKGITALLAIFLVFGFMFASAYSQEDVTQVDNDVFGNPQRPVSMFLHEEHNETAEIEDCTQCHHLYEDGKLVEDESSEDMRCAECHEEKKMENTPSLMQAFHSNCKGCHQEKKSGPLMCGECHIK